MLFYSQKYMNSSIVEVRPNLFFSFLFFLTRAGSKGAAFNPMSKYHAVGIWSFHSAKRMFTKEEKKVLTGSGREAPWNGSEVRARHKDGQNASTLKREHSTACFFFFCWAFHGSPAKVNIPISKENKWILVKRLYIYLLFQWLPQKNSTEFHDDSPDANEISRILRRL